MKHLAIVALLMLSAVHGHAQTPAPRAGVPQAAGAPQAAVVPQAIRVGDVFHAAVRLDLPFGVQLTAPDSLLLPEDVEHAGRRELRLDTAAVPGGAQRVTVLYPLTAWRPGSYDLPALALRLVGDGTETTVAVQLPSFEVSSVLPADTAGIEPRPARDVLGRNRVWWPILLGLLLAVLVIAALYYWWRRRRRPEVPAAVAPAVVVLPRAAALARLEELRRSGLIERGEMKLFYEQLTEALRHYLAGSRREWSTDLTTGELSARMAAGPGAAHATDLLRILGGADLVKFARAPATPDGGWRDLDAAVAWIERAEPEQDEPGTDDRRVA